MSYEAWGDDDAREVPDGWWAEDSVQVVQGCIRELVAEPVYEGGKMENGISVRFLARLTILQGEAGLIPTDGPLYRDAAAALDKNPAPTMDPDMEHEPTLEDVAEIHSVGDFTDEPSPDRACNAIRAALKSYRCTFHRCGEDHRESGLPLVDVFTPAGDPSIKRGEEELELLVEYLYDTIPPFQVDYFPPGPQPHSQSSSGGA